MHNALILNYHLLNAGIQPDASFGDRQFSVTPEDFAAQMALIKKLKLPVVSLDELVENDYKRKRWHRHVLLITCSDTFLTNNATAMPLLEQYGFPATVFITTQIQTHAECWAQWRQIAAAGCSLGSHTVSHACLTEIPEAQMRQELADSKALIESETGQVVKYLAPPFGAYNASVMQAAQELGYEALLTNKVGVNKFNADLFALKRWTVPHHTSLAEFERMLCRDRKELLAQKVKSRTLNAGKIFLKQSPFEKLKRLIFNR
jgi:peptidoglycan/xylan/chitin deacetylase (PgdA/CDA1 family)